MHELKHIVSAHMQPQPQRLVLTWQPQSPPAARHAVPHATVCAPAPLQVDVDVVCRQTERFRDCYDIDSCDVVVTGIFHQVRPCMWHSCVRMCAHAMGQLGGASLLLLLQRSRRRKCGPCAGRHLAAHLPSALPAAPRPCSPTPWRRASGCCPAQVPELLTTTTAPVLYCEQGHEWLFGDPVRFQQEGRCAQQDKLFHLAMHLPVALAAVSGVCGWWWLGGLQLASAAAGRQTVSVQRLRGS